jgi:hypothetical protein
MIEEFVSAWNVLGKPFAKLKHLSPNGLRRRKLGLRMKDKFFRDNWKLALSEYKANPFMRGEPSSGSRKPFSVDFLIRGPDSVSRILEWRDQRIQRRGKQYESPGS